MKVSAKYSKEELTKAITILKEECGSHETCEDCPFAKYHVKRTYGCIFNDSVPADIETNKIQLSQMEDEE